MSNDRLLMVTEYEQLCGLLSGANNATNGISNLEIQHLAWLAAQVPNGGSIVEIGSHRGKSACAMGCGLRHARNLKARIYAVDLWLKGKGKTFEHYTTDETWRIFNEQVDRMSLRDTVVPRMMSSMAAAASWTGDVELLFIDGNHKYPFVLEDFNAWSKFIPSGGWIAFHDYGTRFDGVDRVVREEAISSGLFEDYALVHRIWSARKK